MHNTAITFFELPVADLNRAVTFYERILGSPMRREVFGGIDTALFAYEKPGIGGALVQDPKRSAQTDGTLVYLNCDGQLDQVLDRVPTAGGSITLPKTDIGAPGFIAIIQDTEGNRVGLHTCPPRG
jgi:uncharacterized protein